MTRESNQESYEGGVYGMTVTMPRHRTSRQSQNSWQSCPFVDLEDRHIHHSRHHQQQRVPSSSNNTLKRSFGRRRKHLSSHNCFGGFNWQRLTPRKMRMKCVVALALSCYAMSFLLFAPVLLQGRSLMASGHGGNVVLSFLRNSIQWSARNHFDDDDDLFPIDDEPEQDDDDDDEEEYFSACILWMDDNHRLEEWLAYHYYLLKLRYVVINVDPRSTTSPQAVVNRWNGNSKGYNVGDNQIHTPLDYDLNMTIVLWNDTQYIDPIRYEFEQAKIAVAKGDEKYKLATEYHKFRQPQFYKACSRHLIAERESHIMSIDSHSKRIPSQWTTFHDTDEFLAFQPELYTDWDVAGAAQQQWNKYETPGYMLKRLNAMKKKGIRHEEKKREKLLDEQQQLQSSDKNFDNQTIITNITTSPLSQMSCVVIPRYQFCSIELTKNETNELLDTSITPKDEPPSSLDYLVPSEFIKEKSLLEHSTTTGNKATTPNASAIVRRFDTLRYKFQTAGLASYGKSILDLSMPDVQAITKSAKPFQTHGIITKICGNDDELANGGTAQNRSKKLQKLIHQERMQINHYLGSWESYNARPNDARKGLGASSTSSKWSENAKSYEKWLHKSRRTRGRESIVVRPWLKGFIRLVGGPRVAAHLLQDAGIIVHEDESGAGELGKEV